jgi:hypothetical protein
MNDEESKIQSVENMDKFRLVWSEFDPEGTYFIPVIEIIAFLTLL